MLLGEISKMMKDIFITDIFYVIKFHFGRENKGATICSWTLDNSGGENFGVIKIFSEFLFHSGSS